MKTGHENNKIITLFNCFFPKHCYDKKEKTTRYFLTLHPKMKEDKILWKKMTDVMDYIMDNYDLSEFEQLHIVEKDGFVYEVVGDLTAIQPMLSCAIDETGFGILKMDGKEYRVYLVSSETEPVFLDENRIKQFHKWTIVEVGNV
mgnify:FL=1